LFLRNKRPIIIICIPLIAEAFGFPLALKLLHLFYTKLFGGPILEKPLLIGVINHGEHLKAAKVAEFDGFFQKTTLTLLESIQTICFVSYVVYVVDFLSDHVIK
jgi:hypothetical protein